MKNFLQSLLIFFSLCLCGLIAFQWFRETGLRGEVQKLTDNVQDKKEIIQGLEATKKRNESEIQRLDALKNDLSTKLKASQDQNLVLTNDLEKAHSLIDRHEKQIDLYKQAVENSKATIETQNQHITTQNEELKKLADERNDFVRQLNKLAGEHKDLVERWNKHMDEHTAAQSNTNAPAKK